MAGGLVYMAFAIGFPAPRSGKAVTYTVNNDYCEEHGGSIEPDA